MSTRVILVTGANGGLGQSIANAFVDENTENFVYLGVHRRRDRVDDFVAKYPKRCACVSLDVTSRKAWDCAVTEILERQNRLDVLVNNAGGHHDGLLATLPPSAWEEVFRSNLDSVFHGCQAVLKHMIAQRGGRIVNIASLSALLAPAGQANYAAAKAGVVALTQSLAKEVARLGITVNAICPGYVETNALAAWDTNQREAALGRIPMRRFGRPEEIAAAVRFLACAEASYITGSILKIDGGIL